MVMSAEHVTGVVFADKCIKESVVSDRCAGPLVIDTEAERFTVFDIAFGVVKVRFAAAFKVTGEKFTCRLGVLIKGNVYEQEAIFKSFFFRDK